MYVSRFFFPRFFWRRTSVSRRRRHGGTGGRRFAPPSAAGRLRAAFGRRLMDKTSLSFAFVSLKLWIAGCLASTSRNSVLFDLQLSDRSEACAFQGPPARCFDTADPCTVGCTQTSRTASSKEVLAQRQDAHHQQRGILDGTGAIKSQAARAPEASQSTPTQGRVGAPVWGRVIGLEETLRGHGCDCASSREEIGTSSSVDSGSNSSS